MVGSGGIPPADPAPGWGALVVEVPAPLEDELAGALGLGAHGVELLPAARPGWVRLRVFLRRATDEAGARKRAAAILAAHGLGECAIGSEIVADGRWVERYQAQLRPFAVGSGLWIDPSGAHALAEPGRRRLVLVPGRAFGTGEHPTTQLCVEWLECRVEPGTRWLDLGCGSGILALVAVLHGATEVLGVDDDPDAVAVAHEVARANVGPGPGPRFEHGSLERAGPGWDGVVANIAAPFFRQRAKEIVGVLRPGGVLVASGFLVEDADEIAGELRRAGLDAAARSVRPPWAALAGRRGA